MASGKSVLVVEDDHHLLFAITEVLTDCGFDAKVAIDGHAALQMLQTMTPDLIILDLMMPFMSGFEVLDWLKEHRPGIPIVLSTTADEYAASDLGAAAKLSKPFTADDLIAVIEAVLQAKDLPPR